MGLDSISEDGGRNIGTGKYLDAGSGRSTRLLADDQDATLPLVYDGGAEEGRRFFVWGTNKMGREIQACPSHVLHKYEASCPELLVALSTRRLGTGRGVVSVVPAQGMLALPTPLQKQGVRSVAEHVKWDDSSVTDKAVDMARGTKVERLDKQEEKDALGAVAKFWGASLFGNGASASVDGKERRDTRDMGHKQPQHRLPRGTRRQMRKLEADHEHEHEHEHARAEERPTSSNREVRPRKTIYASSYYYVCVFVLLYMRPHTTIYVSSY